jgi:hypothetical protein
MIIAGSKGREDVMAAEDKIETAAIIGAGIGGIYDVIIVVTGGDAQPTVATRRSRNPKGTGTFHRCRRLVLLHQRPPA